MIFFAAPAKLRIDRHHSSSRTPCAASCPITLDPSIAGIVNRSGKTDMKLRNPSTWMWGEALEMLERADRLHRQFFQPGDVQGWEPPVDIFETEHGLTLFVALPGVTSDQLAIVVDNGALVIRGRRMIPAICRNAKIRQLEIPYGRFERQIELPPGQFEVGPRTLQDGCLVLTLNKV
jgi:HSP20 family molecular chaperone IbpA